MAARLTQPVCLITDGGKLRSQNLLVPKIEKLLQIANGQIGLVQIREQVVGESQFEPATDRELFEIALEIKQLCVKYGAKCIINSRVDIALALGMDGVHLGRQSISVADARLLLGEQAIIGYSAHSVQEALDALDCETTHVSLSPIFKPLSKSNDTRQPIGVEELSNLCSATSGIVYALGGIESANIDECYRAGASGVAVISSLLFAAEPEAIFTGYGTRAR